MEPDGSGASTLLGVSVTLRETASGDCGAGFGPLYCTPTKFVKATAEVSAATPNEACGRKRVKKEKEQ